MDDIDRQLIDLLQQNARLTQEALGQRINLSRPVVHERLRRLESQGVIRGYTALVDWEALGFPVTAFIWVRTSNPSCQDAVERVWKLQSASARIEACHRVTGEWCLLLKVRVPSPRELEAFIDRLRALLEMVATNTVLSLSDLNEGSCKPSFSG
jgi:Lrp/AsnC family leucine-responsive transcriptional regulator